MAVTIEQRRASLWASGAVKTINLAAPSAGDVVYVATMHDLASSAATVASVTGLGATWSQVYNDGVRLRVWKGVGANAAGDVTVTWSAGVSGVASAWVVRGLTNEGIVAAAVVSTAASTSVAGPIQQAALGNAVLAFSTSVNASTGWPVSPVPAAGWSGTNSGPYSNIANRVPASAAEDHQVTLTASSSRITVAQIVVGPPLGAAGTTVAGSTATESDAAQAGATTAGASVVGGRASETDTAQSGTVKAGAVVLGGQAAEADAAQGGAVATGQVVAGSQATEADAAQSGATAAGAVVAGGQASEADTAQPGAVTTPDGMTAIDLSTFINLAGSTTWDGSVLAGSPARFAFPLVVDPATTYTVEVDFTQSGADGYLDLALAVTPDDTGAADAISVASAYPLAGTGTATLTIGPGLGWWDDAVAAGGRFVTYYADNIAITGIRFSPALEVGEVVIPDPPSTGTDLIRAGGRARGGVAVATWEAPVVQPPRSEPRSDRRVGAVALSQVTIDGTRPVFTVSTASKKRLRHRIMVGGKDVSFYRGVATPEPEYDLGEPLLWGPGSIVFPQIAAAFETPGELTTVSDLRWCAKGKPVVVQRVTAAGEIVATDYRGVVVAYDVTDGGRLRLELGGHGTGRAALRDKPVPIFRDTLDIGRLAWAAVRDLGLRFEPRMGPETGIRQALSGGTDFLTYITDLCAKAWQRDGTQWTIMPSEAGVYRMKRKDRTTVDFTVFTDGVRAVPSLRSDAAEEPNRIFAAGVTPKGQRVRFGVYPGLKPSKPAPYPFADGRQFGPGTTDQDTDTGNGIFVMVRTLWAMGYLSLEDATGEYDADVAKAVSALAADAEVAWPIGGVMSEELWRALFDVDTTGYSLRGARIEPAAQASWTKKYRRSASGRVLGKNPRHRRGLIVDRSIDFGAGFTRHQMREWSRAEIDRGEDNWVGTIDITTGGVLHGQVAAGADVDGDDVMDVREIKPGMNAWLPTFAGGILVHVSAVQVTYSDGIPNAKLYVDTQARDAMTVWQIIERNRETRRDPARRWKGNRASGELKDSVTEWDEVGGVLYDDVDLQPGWNVVPVVAGQEGTVARLRLRVLTGLGDDGDGVEFACAVFGKKISPARLNTLVKSPLADSVITNPDTDEDDEDEPKPPPLIGDRAWERRSVKKVLRARWHLYSAGTHREPCGYSPGRKTWETTTSQANNPAYDPDADSNSTGEDDDEFISLTTTTAHGKLTGVHADDAGFSYRTAGQPVLYLAVYVRREAVLAGGRVMWNQLEAGA